jgi:hypothetical protein
LRREVESLLTFEGEAWVLMQASAFEAAHSFGYGDSRLLFEGMYAPEGADRFGRSYAVVPDRRGS